jgi:flagellar export protein FliJ
MPFQFSLDAVLRVRQSLEHQKELLLREANHRVALVQGQIDDLKAALLSARQRELHQLSCGLSAAELHFDGLCRSAIEERLIALAKEMIAVRGVRDTCAARFRQAKQDREVVDTLRERQLRLYREFEARRQQREVDDLFLMRRELRRRR